MTGLYVYGIARHPVRKRLKGVFGRPLRSMAVGRLFAVVETAARAPRPSVARITAQSRVVARIVASGTDLLPARFGSYAADRQELLDLLAGREAELARTLDFVGGCVQITLRVRHTRTSRPRARRSSTGTAYLHSRADLAGARRADPLLRAIARAVRPHVRAGIVEWDDDRPSVTRVHHLVPRDRVLGYRDALSRAIARHEARVAMTGPWAPFAFANST